MSVLTYAAGKVQQDQNSQSPTSRSSASTASEWSQRLLSVTNKRTNASDLRFVLERRAQLRQPSLSHPYKQDPAYGFSDHFHFLMLFSRKEKF